VYFVAVVEKHGGAREMNVGTLNDLMERLKRFLGIECRLVLLLMTALLTMPAQVEALGFGALSLTSHLNQALKADIPMLLNDADDMKTVRVELATAKEYEQLGLQWQSDLSRVQVLIQDRFSSHPLVQLRSTGLMNAPMLSIVLKAKKTGRGTYFKHYQLMLDPVEKSQRTELKNEPKREQVTSLSTLVFEALSFNDAPSSSGKGAVWARTWRYGPVQAGDNLSEIAYRLRLDRRFSNKQVMLSLYENNADAFVDGNINHLIKGAWLTVPRGDVVKKYAGTASMQKLSTLLKRENPTTTALKKVGAKTASNDAASKGDQSLRYSGKIGLNGPGAVDALNAVSELKLGMDQQFEIIHKGMMAGKLQMATLDDTVSTLNLSMQGVKSDIHRLQKDIEIIKMRTEMLPAEASDSWGNWQFAVIVALFVALIWVLVILMMQRKKSTGRSHASAVSELEPESDHLLLNDHHAHDVGMMESQFDSMPDPLMEDPDAHVEKGSDQEPAPLSDEVVQLLNQIEGKLGQCHYDEAEIFLDKVDAQSPDSLKASALKAQLYHETGRFDERNDLINNLSEVSDEARWERFCYFLPSHVWSACFGDSASSEDAQKPV